MTSSRSRNNHLIDIARGSFVSSHNPAIQAEFVSLAYLKAQISSFGTVYLISAAIVLVGAALALLIKIPKNREISAVETPIE